MIVAMTLHKSRILLLSALLLTHLSGCSVVNSLRMMQINSNAKPEFTDQTRVRLESVFEGEKPYVYATVNGEKLLFLLDTGARFLILMDTPKVKQMQLERGFDLALNGWGQEGASPAFQTDIGRIDLGGVYFDDMKAAMIPVSQTHYYLREDEAIYDGVIGHDMMRHFTWEIDANRNEIIISQQRYQPEADAQYLELSSFFSKISVQGDLAFNDSHTVNGEFIVDTGSRHYLKINATYPETNEIDIASHRVRAADFGLSGKVEHDRVTLPHLSFGDLRIDNVKVNLIPGGDEDDWWVLGNALMNQFKTVIDYQHDAFYLVPQKPFVTDYNLLGIELRKIRSGNFVVRYLFPDLPGSKYDLQVGDIVTRINDRAAHEVSLSDYNDTASRVGEHSICIERDNRCFTLSATAITGYSQLSK